MIKNIGVIGAGVMGSDIAVQFSMHGYSVFLIDLANSILDGAKEKIKNDFSMLQMMNEKIRTLTLDSIYKNIVFSTDLEVIKSCDLIIENIIENKEEKKRLYGNIKNLCREDTLIAVNTSCLSITEIASYVSHPKNVIGTHFMNPVPLKKMVELIRGYYTSEEAISSIKSLLESVDKTCVVVNDYPGFVTNRVLMLTINECIFVVQDNVSNPSDVDKIFRLGFGHKMGPLATADLIGLDTILNSLNVLYDSYKDPKYRPAPLLVKMVNAALLGRKSGKGFFDYRS